MTSLPLQPANNASRLKAALAILFMADIVYLAFLHGTLPWDDVKTKIITKYNNPPAQWPATLQATDLENLGNIITGAVLQNIQSARNSNTLCLSPQSGLRDLVAATGQVIITMPAKGAGTSIKSFADECFNNSFSHTDNFLNFLPSPDILLQPVPPVLASHIYHHDLFLPLIKNLPRRTLLVYSHRDETDRLLSAIKHVMGNICWELLLSPNSSGILEFLVQEGWDPPARFFEKMEGNNCFVSDANLLKFINTKTWEIGDGEAAVLSCETYKAIDESAPNLVFMNYKKANNLMGIISEKYCPRMNVGITPVEENVSTKKKESVHVEFENQSTGVKESVPLDDWLNARKYSIEWALGLNSNASCRARTRVIEDDLDLCTSGFLKI